MEKRLFAMVCSDRTRNKCFKLKESNCRLDVRKTFFTLRVVRQCNRLPREVVDAPPSPPKKFKVRLDGTLSNLIYWKVSWLMAETR